MRFFIELSGIIGIYVASELLLFKVIVLTSMQRVTSSDIRPALTKQYMTSRSQVSPHKEINWLVCSCTMVTSVSASDEREPPVSKAENEKENTNASQPKLDWVRCMVLMMSAFLSYAWLQDLILVSLPQWLKQRTQPSTYLCRGQAWQPLYILVSI